jgi:hypothetical protein
MFAAQLTLRVTLAWYGTGRLPGFTAYLRLAKLMILYKSRVSARQLWMHFDRIMSFHCFAQRDVRKCWVKHCIFSACKLWLLGEQYFRLWMSARNLLDVTKLRSYFYYDFWNQLFSCWGLWRRWSKACRCLCPDSGRFIAGTGTRYPVGRRLGGSQGRERKISPPHRDSIPEQSNL